MTYAQDVKRAKRLVENIDFGEAKIAELTERTESDRWALAELTYANTCSENHSHAKVCGKVSQTAWGKDVGLGQVQVSRYRAVWATYSQESVRPTMTSAMNEVRTDTRSGQGLKAMVRNQPDRVVEEIMSAPEETRDRIYHDVKLRRAAEPVPDRTSAGRKAFEARVAEHTEPVRKWGQSVAVTNVLTSLAEAAEYLEEALEEGNLDRTAMDKIQRAYDKFAVLMIEANSAVDEVK